MRIMWFCNTPSLASDYLGTYGESWIKSLQAYFEENNIQLGVTFFFHKNIKPFELNGTKYFPIYRKANKTKIKKTINRLRSSFKPYLEFDAKECLSYVEAFNPDIIHIQGTENPFGLIKKYTKKPIVISIQGNLTVVSKFYFRDQNKFGLMTRTPLLHWLLFKDIFMVHRAFRLRSIVEQEIFTINKYFIGRTDWDRRVSHSLNPVRAYFEAGEILRKSFYKNRWQYKAKEKFILTSVIRANIYKGIETVMEAASILDKMFHLNFVWNIIGTAEDNLIIKMLGISKIKNRKVNFLGFKNEDEIVELLLESDLYVHPSHIENSPNAVGEAQLLGMPIVATYAGGMASMIKDGETGILVQDGDQWHMAGAIVEVLSKPALMQELGNNGHKEASERHSAEKIFHSTQRIYEAILETERQE